MKPLLITTGEPAGIGMDIVLLLASQNKLSDVPQPIVILANIAALKARQDELYNKNSLSRKNLIQAITIADIATISQKHRHDTNQDNTVHKTANPPLYVIDMPTAANVVAGQLNVDNAPMVLAQLALAHELAMSRLVAAIVTAPLQKSVIMHIKPDFMGHTEYFMAQSGLNKVVMMLANNTMKVALVTTHLPLRAVPDAITADEIQKTVDIVLADCQRKFGLKRPHILVCGLNPHAGEDGYLGREEIDIINPVLQQYRDRGINISLAMPADTLFTRHHVAQADVIIAMYHDQGLAPLKSHGFGETVNITLGLPYIRTSVDHGTALDLAGTGKASADSLYQAISYASHMAVAKM